MPFKKGQSGNPAGRKPGIPNKATADIKALAQVHGSKAIAVLVKIMNDLSEPSAVRTTAAKELLDRGYGKAKQEVNVQPGDGWAEIFEAVDGRTRLPAEPEEDGDTLH